MAENKTIKCRLGWDLLVARRVHESTNKMFMQKRWDGI